MKNIWVQSQGLSDVLTKHWQDVLKIPPVLYLHLADGDCNHEIKRCLTPWKKIYDQPGQHIKKQDITLPTKVHLVKAMVFPVVVYGCESWTIKKAEHG